MRKPIISAVKVGMGATIPTGDYANMRPEVHVEVTLPENPTKEEIKAAFDVAWSQVEEQMNRAIDAITEDG